VLLLLLLLVSPAVSLVARLISRQIQLSAAPQQLACLLRLLLLHLTSSQTRQSQARCCYLQRRHLLCRLLLRPLRHLLQSVLRLVLGLALLAALRWRAARCD
jgi:hypothetical protein